MFRWKPIGEVEFCDSDVNECFMVTNSHLIWQTTYMGERKDDPEYDPEEKMVKWFGDDSASLPIYEWTFTHVAVDHNDEPIQVADMLKGLKDA